MACELDMDKCPVCHGAGRAFDNRTGDFSGRKCFACGGSGEAKWKEKVPKKKDHQKQPAKPRERKPGLPPRKVMISQHTGSYDEYVSACEAAGIDPLSRKKILGVRTYWRNAGVPGLRWIIRWSKEEKEILFSSRSYIHYTIKIRRYNSMHGTNLPTHKRKTTVSCISRHPDERMYSWHRKLSTYLLEDVDGNKPDIAFSTFERMCRAADVGFDGEYNIIDIYKKYAKLGSTKDLTMFLRTQSLMAKGIKRRLYVSWLKERTCYAEA